VRVLMAVLSFVAVLVVGAPAASAMEVDRFVGGASGGLGGEFTQPRDVAVNEASGDVYVADEANQRIVRLSATGGFERAWGRDVVSGNVGEGFEVCSVASECKAGVQGQAAGEFINPAAVAVDQSDGSVYVWDTRSGNSAFQLNVRVQKFDADGGFVLTFGRGVNQTTGGDVCTQASGDLCGPGLPGSAAGQLGNNGFNRPGVAVSPVDGDVFVTDPINTRVQRFNSDGSFQAVIGSSANFGSSQPRAIAIDSRGILYASDGNPGGQIDRYDSAGVHGAPGLLSSIAAPPLLAGSAATATVGLEVDPDSEGDGAAGADTDRLYVLRDPSTGNTVVQQFDSPGEVVAPAAVTATHGNAAGFQAVIGLGLNSATGRLYVSVATGSVCGGTCHGVFILDADGTGTDIGASDVAGANATSTSIDLVGTVDPDEGLVRYRFLYSADGLNYDATPFQRTDVAGQVSYQLTGLDPNSLYRVRLEVEKILGPTNVISATSADSITSTAAAAPEVTTLGSANRTATSVQLRATVDPNGSATTYRFEYGPDGGSFTSGRIPVPDAPVGSGNTADLVTQTLTGLIPATAYHYRVVATNASGTSTGTPVSFTTDAIVDPQPPAGARAYELVSPADKVGGAGVGLWGGGTLGAAVGTGRAARQGERYAALGDLGSVLLDGTTAYGRDWAFGERTAGGWVSHSPATHAPSNEQAFKVLTMSGASDDLSTVIWGTNGALLRPFPELAGWPPLSSEFVGDWDGRWEMLAPTNLDQVYSSTNDSLTKSVVSADGSNVVATVGLVAGKAILGGLAGPGDPAHPDWSDLVAGRVTYIDDVSAGLSDEFDGNGVYSNVGVCAGGTALPERTVLGTLEDRSCPAPLAGRDARLVSERGAVVHAANGSDPGQSIDNVVSRDGSRVFFLSPDPLAAGVPAAGCSGTDDGTVCAPQLYVRQRNDDGSVITRWISKAEEELFGAQEAGLTGPVRFAGASPDGDKVFFQTTSPLTADDPNGTGAPAPAGGVTTGTASTSSWDLYMYDLPDGPDPAGGSVTRISGGPTGNADCNVVVNPDEGALRFTSDAGSRAYFTCQAPLPGTGLPANGTITTPGGTVTSTNATNLYAYDATGDTADWKFVARLPRAGAVGACATRGTGRAPLLTSLISGSQVGFGTSATHCVRGSADGSFITFWTTEPLTLDDPDAVSVDGYAYDVAADELTRITAPQGGVGGSYPCGSDTASLAVPCHGDNGFGTGGALPQLDVATAPSTPGDRVAFFQTRSRLVPADLDDAYDVYEWRNGDLNLLSTGNSAGDGDVNGIGGAFYTGNDASGTNVYIATNDKLSWQDVDAVMDVYTARVGGGIPQPVPPSICGVLAGGCQGSGAGTVAAPTPTSTTTGDGDATPGARATLSVAGIGRKARTRAAKRGVLAVRVRTSDAGRLTAVARGRVGGRTRVLGKATKQAGGAGVRRIAVRLNRLTRRALRSGRVLRVTVQVRQAGARSRSTTVRLVGGPRS
jgi:hypothetical protein